METEEEGEVKMKIEHAGAEDMILELEQLRSDNLRLETANRQKELDIEGLKAEIERLQQKIIEAESREADEALNEGKSPHKGE